MRARPVIAGLLLGVGAVTGCSASSDDRIADDTVYFNCVDQLVERIRASTCRIDLDDGTVEEVLAESVTTWGPAVSPDRRHVVVTENAVSDDDGATRFVVLDSRNGEVVSIDVSSSSLGRSWTPTGDAVLTNSESGFIATPVDGSDAEVIDIVPPAAPIESAMSPDGTMIAAAVDGSAAAVSRFAVYDRTTGGQLLAEELESISSIAWTSSSTIAVSADAKLVAFDVRTGTSTTIASSPGDRFFGIAWSPEMALLAAVRGSGVVVYDVETGTANVITPADVVVASGPPAWSPDGTRLVVSGFDIDEPDARHLFSIDIDTGDVDVLTESSTADVGNLGAAFPSWR